MLEIKLPAGYAIPLINQPVCDGVFLREFHVHFENFTEKVSPALFEHTIVFQTRGAVTFKRWVIKSAQNYSSYQEDVGIVPCDLESNWLLKGDCTVVHLYFQPSLVASTAIEALDKDPARIEFVPIATFHDQLMFAIAMGLREEILSGGCSGRLYSESLIYPLLIRILRKYIAFPQEPIPVRRNFSARDLRQVREFIHDNLASDLTLTQLARIANLSPYHLARVFKQATGQSLHQYVIAERVAVAQHLILSGRCSLSTVAQEVGFADQSHLNRNFKRLLGISPGVLLKESKN